MVSTEYQGTRAPTSVSRMAALPGRADGIAAALKTTIGADCALPDSLRTLLDQLDAVPDRP